jgi:hypothetical protein
MSGLGLAILLSAIYVVLIITLALLSFRKGHWVLGLIGFVFPVLWVGDRRSAAGTPLALTSTLRQIGWIERQVRRGGGQG